LIKSTEFLKGISSLIGWDQNGPYLKGGKCNSCQTVSFPERSICPNCIGQDIETVSLSRRGKLYTFTEVYQKPPDYFGEVPYVIGRVLLPEGVFVLTQIKAKEQDLKLNMDMELIVESIYKDESGQKQLGYKFKPV
jgi:uncharacterized OB-fold protein